MENPQKSGSLAISHPQSTEDTEPGDASNGIIRTGVLHNHICGEEKLPLELRKLGFSVLTHDFCLPWDATYDKDAELYIMVD